MKHKCTIRGLYKRLKNIFIDYDSDVFEIFTAFSAMLWGFAILHPSNFFELNQAFRVMDALAPNYIWAAASMTLGAVQMFYTLADMRKLRKEVALIMSMFWLFVSLTFILSGTVSTAWAIYPSYALFSFQNYYHLLFRP